jgi:hypothetical protein
MRVLHKREKERIKLSESFHFCKTNTKTRKNTERENRMSSVDIDDE